MVLNRIIPRVWIEVGKVMLPLLKSIPCGLQRAVGKEEFSNKNPVINLSQLRYPIYFEHGDDASLIGVKVVYYKIRFIQKL